MAITARRVVEAARDRHPGFDPKSHPDPVALRFLSDYQRHLFGRVADANPSIVAASAEIDFPLDDFELGNSLPAFKDVQGGTIYFLSGVSTGQAPLRMVDWENRLDARFSFAAWTHHGRIHFSGDADRWAKVQRVVVEYIPEPEQLGGMNAELILPDAAYLACTSAVAAFLGGRIGVNLSGAQHAAEEAYLEEVRRSKRAHRVPRYIRR